MLVYLVPLIIGAYLLGSIPTAYLIARWRRGVDIRRVGSGNVGVTNVIASGSRLSSVIVIIFDFLKGGAPVYLARSLGMQPYEQVAVGLAAICGHNWTVFLRFSGGRGVLTTLGVISVLAPWLALTLLAINCLFGPFKQFALGTLVAMVLLPLLSWFFAGFFQVDRSLQYTLGFTVILAVLVARRLTAPRTELAASVSTREMMLNRLLFDRDIRDRNTWLRRNNSTAHAG